MAGPKPEWLALSLLFASLSASAAISHYIWRRTSKSNVSNEDERERIQELEVSLKLALEKCAAERKGRVRAQQNPKCCRIAKMSMLQALREALSRPECGDRETYSYPMVPIAVVQSCFSTRNGTPRQPLLVPLGRASLKFDPARVPQASLEGLEGYSHCWVIFVFHLNTDLHKLWKNPSQSGFKAKVRVPRLKGERVGVFATRSPHRPCPIGLTVAKLEAIHGHTLLVSDVDLVDGTPVLDIKPYLPYCDSIQGSKVPAWVKENNALTIASVNFSEDFSSSLADCWSGVEQKSLYASPEEFLSLIKQVLSCDIRSVSQRTRSHQFLTKTQENLKNTVIDDYREESFQEDNHHESGGTLVSSPVISSVVYHLVLECFDISYRIDSSANIFVDKVALVE